MIIEFEDERLTVRKHLTDQLYLNGHANCICMEYKNNYIKFHINKSVDRLSIKEMLMFMNNFNYICQFINKKLKTKDGELSLPKEFFKLYKPKNEKEKTNENCSA